MIDLYKLSFEGCGKYYDTCSSDIHCRWESITNDCAYRTLMEYDIKPIQAEVLRIFRCYQSLCEKHGLRYYAYCGTALGAIRHKGFIPWDDDLDVLMPRPDYTKFVAIARDELPDGLCWQSIETDANYQYQFGKVRVVDDEKANMIAKASGLNLNQGLYIDVFPLDGFTTSETGRLFWHIKRGLFRRGFTRWIGPIPYWYGRQDQSSRLHFRDWISKRDYESSSMVAGVSSYDAYSTPQRWVFPKQWFDDWREVPFEDGSIRISIGAVDMLKGMYGDYMQLPPEEQRKPSHQALRM